MESCHQRLRAFYSEKPEKRLYHWEHDFEVDLGTLVSFLSLYLLFGSHEVNNIFLYFVLQRWCPKLRCHKNKGKGQSNHGLKVTNGVSMSKLILYICCHPSFQFLNMCTPVHAHIHTAYKICLAMLLTLILAYLAFIISSCPHRAASPISKMRWAHPENIRLLSLFSPHGSHTVRISQARR